MLTLQPKAEGGGIQTLPGEVYLYVLSGTVLLQTDVYAPLSLTTGDAVFFDGRTEHSLHSAIEGPSVVLMIVSGDEGFWRKPDA